MGNIPTIRLKSSSSSLTGGRDKEKKNTRKSLRSARSPISSSNDTITIAPLDRTSNRSITSDSSDHSEQHPLSDNKQQQPKDGNGDSNVRLSGESEKIKEQQYSARKTISSVRQIQMSNDRRLTMRPLQARALELLQGLQDDALREGFLKYGEGKYINESIDFLVDVQKYRGSYYDKGDRWRRLTVMKIKQRYFDLGSNQAINVSGKLRAQVESDSVDARDVTLQSVPLEVFDDAINEVTGYLTPYYDAYLHELRKKSGGFVHGS